MSNLKISELNETSTAPASSYIPIDDGELTQKITVENFNATGAASAAQSAAAAALSETAATTAATTATAAATEATTAKTQAVSAKTAAETAQGYAEAAQSAAEAAQSAAETAAQSITTAAATAVEKAAEATTAASNASTSENLAKSYSETAEAYGAGTVNGTPVSEQSEQYHNNAKYYSEQAADSASSASTSATSAANSATAAGDSATSASSSATTATDAATTATNAATSASTSATLAQSYAKGDTGSRSGETTDNAKYYSEQASSSATDAANSASSASDSAAAAEAWSAHPPYIGANGDWYVYDTTTEQYVDSGVDATLSIAVGTVSTREPGAGATVTNVGTSTDAIFNFGIEKGYSPEVTITEITGGHRVTITDKEHPAGQSFDVMDGSGSGSASAISDLTDVQLTSLANGEVLVYNSTAAKWKNHKLGIADMSDVNMTGIQDGQVLVWDDVTSKLVAEDQSGASYTAGPGIDISQQNEISTEAVIYSGSTPNWQSKTLAEKLQFTHAILNDDTQSGIVDPVPVQNSVNLVASGGVYSALSGKANTSDLATVATSGDYDDLTDKPTLGTAASKDSTNAVTQNSTDLVESGAVYTALSGKANSSDLATVATSGDYDDLTDKPTLGTASGKNFTTFVSPGNLDVPISTSVYSAITSAVHGAYHPAGSKSCAELTADLLVLANIGNVYKITDDGTTTNLFIGGAGQTIHTGDSAVVVYGGAADTYLFSLESGVVDLSAYQTKELTAPITVDGVQKTNVEDTLSAINTLAANDKTAINNIKDGSTIDSFADVETELGAIKDGSTIDSFSDVETALGNKADTATTLSGYGITDAYTKTETDSAVSAAINALDVTDTAVAGSYVTAVSETDGSISVTREAADTTPTSASTKMLTSGGAYTALADKADKVTSATNGDFAGLDASGNLTDSGKKASDFATAQGLADEISTRAQLGAHNLNIYPYKNGKAGDVWSTNGIDFTVNSDGSITADGTATADAYFRCGISTDDTNPIHLVSGKKYILSGSGQANVSVRLRNSSNTGVANATTSEAVYECSSTGSYYILLEVPSGITVDNLTIYPMLRLATDSDSTYEPYAKSNQVITEDFQTMYKNNGILGVKNLLPTPYYATKGGTATSGTLTATENADGSITINGTASGQSYIDLARNDKFLKAGTYILSGGITSKQYVYINCLNNGTYIKTLVSAITSEVKFVLDYNGYDAITVGISIASGESLSNVTFYPMIRLASDTDTTYQPYAKTNRELTIDKAELTQLTNPNLLDNPWFTVNQRDFSSNSSQGALNYTVDRWCLIYNPSGRTLSKTNNGITIDTNSGVAILWQLFATNKSADLVGRTVTASVMLSDGTIYYGTGVVPAKDSAAAGEVKLIDVGNFYLYLQYTTSQSKGFFATGIYFKSGKTCTIKAVKLELGTVSTLANDSRPDYTTELTKCQRYFVNVFQHKQNYAGPYFAEGNANQLYFAVNLPVPMRITPRIELDSESIYTIGNNAHTTITTYTAGVTCIDNNVLKVFLGNFDATEITDVNNHLYALNFFDSNTKKFWLSADL